MLLLLGAAGRIADVRGLLDRAVDAAQRAELQPDLARTADRTWDFMYLVQIDTVGGAHGPRGGT